MHRSVAVGLVLAGVLVGCGAGSEVVEIEARPSELATTDAPSTPPSPTPSPTPSDTTPSPTEEASRPPTATDRARFVQDFDPVDASDVEHVATDLDGDGVDELVFTYVRGGRVSHLEVAWWDGSAYLVMFTADGGPASSVDRVRTSDVNADGHVEIVVFQSADADQSSLSLWQVVGPGQVEGLAAVGGCHDGSITYGAAGAELDDRDADGADEIYATCDDSPLPVREWSTDRYQWEAGAYHHAPSLVR